MSGDVADAHNHWTIGKQIKIVVAITRAIVRTFDFAKVEELLARQSQFYFTSGDHFLLDIETRRRGAEH
jgi:hypothetical protein